jgi:hypothetical protein
VTKLIIAGSRDVTQHQFDWATQFALWEGISEIVSGTARGVDRYGEELAEQLGIPVKRFPADWDKYGKSAGYKRNVLMAEYADKLLAIWDGHSKGTGHMIDIMQKVGKPVQIVAVLNVKKETSNHAQ